VSEPIRVIKGNPTEEELAALLMVLGRRTSTAKASPDTPTENGWSAYWRSVRAPIRPGPGVWRVSGREG
jgi:Acyl-CoA carboxylase epsilon subunit